MGSVLQLRGLPRGLILAAPTLLGSAPGCGARTSAPRSPSACPALAPTGRRVSTLPPISPALGTSPTATCMLPEQHSLQGPHKPSAQPQPQWVAPLLFKHPLLDALVDFPASVSAVTRQFPGATDCWGSWQHHREAICVGAPIVRLPGALRHAAEK